MRKRILSFLTLVLVASGFSFLGAQNNDNVSLQKKIDQYAVCPLQYDIKTLSPKEQELLGLFIEISDVMDELYWEQAFGIDNRTKIRKMNNPVINRFADIQYGAWDRLNGNKSFVKGFGDKPAGANFYPTDMKPEEFEALKDPRKTSPYTVIQRDKDRKLQVVPYSQAYESQIKQAEKLLDRAINVCDNESMRRYLQLRREALRTDDYFQSDVAWMEMNDNRLDFVFGPIESYEDGLYGYKTAYEAFVLVKDNEWSHKLKRYTRLLPELQRMLPCEEIYKKEEPGTNCDINVYDVLYYAGNCNAGGKTIAINLPNDERIQMKFGSRRLQLKNVMAAKYEKILIPIAKQLISTDQLSLVKFDAFFNNVCFHEVAHGMGIKKTINDRGTVREALQNQYSAFEEAKADICGLYIVQRLIERGEIRDLTIEEAYVTFLAGLLRSVRFGATEAHGIANIMCFNYMHERGAITRNRDGKYSVDIKKMHEVIDGWIAFVLKMEGDGDYRTAKEYVFHNGVVRSELSHDLSKLENANIPIDLHFEQGARVLGLDMKRFQAGNPNASRLPTLKKQMGGPFEHK